MSSDTKKACDLRAARAEQAVLCHAHIVGYNESSDVESVAEDVIYLLTDLQHFCDGKGLEFSQLVERSNMHFGAEIRGEE